MISEDMAILEAKLQTIDGAGNCTTYSHPNTPPHTCAPQPAGLQQRVKRSISVDVPLTSSMISSEDNLDPIEEEQQQQQKHQQQLPAVFDSASTPGGVESG